MDSQKTWCLRRHKNWVGSAIKRLFILFLTVCKNDRQQISTLFGLAELLNQWPGFSVPCHTKCPTFSTNVQFQAFSVPEKSKKRITGLFRTLQMTMLDMKNEVNVNQPFHNYSSLSNPVFLFTYTCLLQFQQLRLKLLILNKFLLLFVQCWTYSDWCHF